MANIAKEAKTSKKSKVNNEIVENNAEQVAETTQVENKQIAAKVIKTVKTTVNGNKEINLKVPEHILNISYILKDNSAIRRHVSLNIINYLMQIGRINRNARAKYVDFMWNKFAVIVDGLRSEFSYNEKFFLDALVTSFDQFAKDAENAISIFVDIEGVNYQDKSNVDNSKDS